MDKPDKKKKFVLTDELRIFFKEFLDKTGLFLHKIGISPNLLTILGLVGHVIATILLLSGHYFWSGLTLAFFAVFDALDGTVARATGQSSDWGAFYDSFVDRYSEIILLGGFIIHFNLKQDLPGILAAYVAITGALLVSYARARAHSLGVDIKEGLFSRVERYFVLVVSLVFGVPFWGLVLLAIGTHITAIQRAYTFYKRRTPK